MGRCLIFDVDGVLLDSPHELAWGEALQALAKEEREMGRGTSAYEPEAYTTEVYQRVVAGKPRYAGSADLLAHFQFQDPDGALVQELGDRKQAMVEYLISQGRFRPYADAVLLALRAEARGWSLGVASSSKNARSMLLKTKLHDDRTLHEMFCADVCGVDFPEGKPHPAIFLETALRAGVKPGHCAVVEDAPSGVRAAKAAGMVAVGIARFKDQEVLRQAGADLVLDSLDNLDLDNLAKRLNP